MLNIVLFILCLVASFCVGEEYKATHTEPFMERHFYIMNKTDYEHKIQFDCGNITTLQVAPLTPRDPDQ